MLVIVSIAERIKLLPYFLRYYTRIGASRFCVMVWNGEANPLFPQIQSALQNYPHVIRTSVVCDLSEYCGPAETPALNLARQELLQPEDWYCVADLDEFYYLRDRSLSQLAEQAGLLGYDAVHGVFFDRVSLHGDLPALGESLDATFPMICDISRTIGANYNKIGIARQSVAIESGHHYCAGRAWQNQIEVHHLKWTDGVVEALQLRAAAYASQGLPWAKEIPLVLAAIQNGIDLLDPNLCARKARELGI